MKNKLDYCEKSLENFKATIDNCGWVIYENAISPEFIDVINKDLDEGYSYRRKIQEENGIGANMAGTLHHLLERDNFSLPFLEKLYCHNEN